MNHFSSMPVKEHSKEKDHHRDYVVLNEDAVLSEIVRMGEGLVQR